jgi:STE24 endopeptidase
MTPISIIFIALLALAVACRVWLLARQIASVRAARDTVPPAFASAVPLEAHRKASDYTVANARLAIVDAVLDALVLLVLIWGGALAAIDSAWRGVGLTDVPFGIAVIASVFVATALIAWPLSLYRVFGIETRFGFNRITWQLYLLDVAKGIVLAAVLGLPLLAAVLALMNAAGELWWLYAWLVWALFTLTLTWAYPAFIAPLFNRFKPVSDEELARRISALIERCGFTSRGVFVMDGSRRSSHGNAYFTGLGANKRIVLFDTLLEQLAPPEIEAVLAHELGHFRLRHVRKRLVLSLALGLVGLYLLALIAREDTFYAAFGGFTPAPHTALLLFFLLLPTLTFWLAPLASAWSRRHEFEADRFASTHASSAELAAALVKLYRDNATTLAPDALYSAFFDSHPPAPVRIARLRANEAARQSTG